MNKVFLIGNLTKDPEYGTTANGNNICRFSIAVNRMYKSSNGENEADFLNITAWRGLADNCYKFLSKGKKIAVVGSIQTRNYEDKNGNKRTSTEIIAEDVEFLSPKEDASTSQNKAKSKLELETVDNNNLPF